MSGNDDERVRDEIEALEAILMDDVTVEYNESGIAERIKTVVFPSTADDTRQQYVCITLEVTLGAEYPDKEPQITLRNPRGLDDSLINDVNRAVKDKCTECLGQPVVFELIELIRERLTESNVPSCQCCVCLYGFTLGDQFTKTQCYHYFHSYCLARHVAAAECTWREERDKLPAWQRQQTGTGAHFQALCPVCREPLACDVEQLRAAPPPHALETQRAFEATAELRALQARMAALYLRQQRRGGIIDVAADENKQLLVLTDTASTPSQEEQEQASGSVVVEPPPPPPHVHSAPTHKRARRPRTKHTR